MAHIFDYSSSTQGLWLAGSFFTPGVSGEAPAGTPLSTEYWSSTGSAVSRVSWNNWGFDERGRWVVLSTGSSPVFLPYDAAEAFPFDNTFAAALRATDPALHAPALLENSGNFVIGTFQADSGFALRLGGVAAPMRLLPISIGHFESYDEAILGARDASDAVNAAWLAQIAAIFNRSLASAGPITAENWAGGASYMRLVYTPDSATRLKIGDLLRQETFDGINPLYIAFNNYTRAFAGEDVLFRLTAQDDIFHLGGDAGFPARSVTIEGGAGNDQITLAGLAGSSDTWGVPLELRVTGGDGNDHIETILRYSATLWGGAGDDTILAYDHPLATNAALLAYGGDGNDHISAPDHATSLLYGDAGNDLITGSHFGNSTLDGGAGNDTLYGGTATDRIYGGIGHDQLAGGDGADTLNGGDGNDQMYGGSTATDLRDVIYGGAGNDTAYGGSGNDDIFGGAGRDLLSGDLGSDTLTGNDGNDTLAGGGGSDLLYGNAGRDYLNGGFGYDRLNGGGGADTFFHENLPAHGSDWVQDYSSAQNDVLMTGLESATRNQFQVNFATTPGAGAAGVAEAFVIYRPTGQILWALVDGAGQSSINLQIGSSVFDLLA